MTETGPSLDGVAYLAGRKIAHDALSSFEVRIGQLHAAWPMSDRTRENLIRALSCIDPVKRDGFLSKYHERLQDVSTVAPAKYADFAYWAHDSVLISQWLDLDRSASLDILDIGMGSGSFAMVAQSMGHRVIGTDVADEWYDELCELAGVRRIAAPVERGQSYRPIDQRFDLVTLMLPVFHRRRVNGRREYWSICDWKALFADLTTGLLKPGGRIFILMPVDVDDEGQLSYSPLLEWAQAHGARLGRTLPDRHIQHLLFAPAVAAVFEA